MWRADTICSWHETGKYISKDQVILSKELENEKKTGVLVSFRRMKPGREKDEEQG